MAQRGAGGVRRRTGREQGGHRRGPGEQGGDAAA